MFLTSGNILRPVASVSFLIVEKSTDAELLSGCSVPAGPVPGARGFVSEDTVQPVAMFSTLGWI